MATSTTETASEFHSKYASKYRGATIEDLDPPPALSVLPSTPIAHALLLAYERDYTHLTVTSPTKSLLGYLSIPKLKSLLDSRAVSDADPVSAAMLKFRRRPGTYKVITMDTPLEELEAFFLQGAEGHGPQEFAVVTDAGRRFVLGVATRGDLEEFARRRP